MRVVENDTFTDDLGLGVYDERFQNPLAAADYLESIRWPNGPVCPHCGETNELNLDPGSGPEQQYVEDCQVCCQPWRVTVRYGADGSADVFTEPLEE